MQETEQQQIHHLVFRQQQGRIQEYHEFSSSFDRLRFNVGGSTLEEKNVNQFIIYNRVNCQNSSQSTSIPALNFNVSSTTTGYSGEQTQEQIQDYGLLMNRIKEKKDYGLL